MAEISTAFALAKELVSSVRPTELSDRLAGSGANQDYTFTLKSRSDVSLTLSKLSGNADLELYRGDGNKEALKLVSSTNSNLTPEIIGATLDAGTYYVRVNPARVALDSTGLPIDYTLKLLVSPLVERPAPAPPLFWHNRLTGQLYAWQMTGADNLAIGSFKELITVPTDWTIAAVVDWDKDGTADLVWHNQQLGQAIVWFMGGDDGTILRDYQSVQSLPKEWELAAVTDWNLDGTQDLIWRTSQGSQSVVWLMDPTNSLQSKESKILTEVPSNWQIVAAADWNLDGVSDLLWRDRVSGANVLWQMGGTDNLTIIGTQTLITVPTNWDVVGVSDWNQDGFKDIVWRNARGGGENVVWFMGGEGNPTQIQEAGSFLTIPVEWNLSVADRKSVPRTPDAIGNTLETATKLGTVQRAQFSNWIGAQNPLDIYALDITEPTTRLSVTLGIVGNLASSDLELWLLDATGKRINPIESQTGSQGLKLQQSISQSLDPGKYYLQVRSQGATSTAYNLKVDSFGIENWLKQNIKDAELQETLRSGVQDGLIDRTDVIALLRSATDGAGVDATEFADLKSVVRDFYELSNDTIAKKTAPWFNLLNKVVNGDAANATYKGSPLGNLIAGSTGAQMTALIDKWFLGGDRPITEFVYQSAAGKLFQNGVSYKDINQGQLSNSPFLAALGALAVTSPNDVRSLFLENGDGTFTVRFLKPDRTADYVTIDCFLPIDQSDILIYARQYSTVGNGRAFDDPANELWAALLEKAFTQWLASGWISGPIADLKPTSLSNRYADLAIVSYGDAFSALSGRSATTQSVNSLSLSTLLNAVQTSSPVGFMSKTYSPTLGAEIASSQTYTLAGYDASTSTFTLFNPWGLFNQYTDVNDPKSNRKPGEISLSIDQIIGNFDAVYTTV